MSSDKPTPAASVRAAMDQIGIDASLDAHNAVASLVRFYGGLLAQKASEISILRQEIARLTAQRDSLLPPVPKEA